MTREQQGLPPQITDPSVLAKLQALQQTVSIPRKAFYEGGFVCITDERFLKPATPA